jgi:anti-sigma factor RsiW
MEWERGNRRSQVAMSNLLHELENNEAILLMYLAGELPEEDRVEVEQMLANDPALRAELAELAALQDGVTGILERVDAKSDLSRREAIVRQVSRALTAARLQPLRTESAPAETARPRLRIAWWAYPIAVAAALLVGIMLLSDNHPMNLPAPQSNQFVDSRDSFQPQATAQIFPDDLEKELISLNSEGTGLFGPGSPDLDR